MQTKVGNRDHCALNVTPMLAEVPLKRKAGRKPAVCRSESRKTPMAKQAIVTHFGSLWLGFERLCACGQRFDLVNLGQWQVCTTEYSRCTTLQTSQQNLAGNDPCGRFPEGSGLKLSSCEGSFV